MKNNKNLTWALVGLLILFVIGGFIYNTDPFGWRSVATVTQNDSTGEKTQADGADKSDSSSTEASADAKSGDGEATADASTAGDATAQLTTPTFDIVRVEPDGSTLIAGQAAPGTAVEVVANGQVIATVKAGTSGDFAAVVDDRLAPGDHEIVLRSTGDGDASAQSEEIATISVPESDPTELLVMVTKPGEASRILAKPEIAGAEVAKEATGAAEAAGETEEKQVAANKAEEATTSATAEEAVAAESATEAKSDKPETEVAASTESAPAKEMTEEKMEERVAMTDQSSDASSTEAAKTEPAAAVDTAQEKAEPETAKAEPETAKAESETAKAEPEVASAEPEATATKETAKSEAVVAAEPTLRIDAVEIENGRMFIAGSATPGGSVRVYADGEAIGTSNVSGSGRFLVEAQKDIAVGDHTISADLVMKAGAAPAMRVAVPFTRPEGEMVAAVAAPAAEPSAQSDKSEENTGDTAAEPSASTSAASETSEKKPEMAAAETSSETAAVADTGTQTTAAADPTTEKAEEKSSPVETADSKDTSTGQGSVDDTASTADTTSAATGSQTEVASADTQSDDTKTVVQPALEQRDGSVIIRRGDTLWQISRRVYGRCVRYTTIYLANEEQIKNPDMIEPGQIFAVPEEPLENAEELHRKRIRSR